MESFVKFKDLLKKLFQFEASDLDFGIYRVLNYKRDKIDKFIQQDLENKVGKAFAKHKDERLTNINQRLEEIKQKIIQSLGEKVFTPNGDLKEEFKDTPLGRDYLSVKAQKEEAKAIDEIKLQVFNDLYNFFSRYYEEGDFVPQYRYSIKGHKYAIPYNGEEVKLYWANQEQYYTKTGLLFRDYTFKANSFKVIFRITSAEEELGSNKATKERFFVLDDKNPVETDNQTLIIRFQYRELTNKEVEDYDIGGGSNTSKQEKINQRSFDQILNKVQDNVLKLELSKDYKNEKPLLLYQLNRFSAKNTKDYFIHKNLKKFLSEQLDYFIKSEVLSIEILEKERYLDKHITRAKVVREIGEDIIDFLSQIEDFQKRLWEKKKFVIKTEYVITLDKIKEYAGEDFFNEVIEEVLKNEGQLNEWRDLGFGEIKNKNDLILKNDLVGKTYKKLPIDTKYFSEDFKEKLLEKLTEKQDLDALLDGLLLKSENWQALNLILNKYKEKVQTIYIDPPYNTGSDGFLYRDRYQHSSWLTMMGNRLSLASNMLKIGEGYIAIHIDDHEVNNLLYLIRYLFPLYDDFTISIYSNPRGRRAEKISKVHDYVIFCVGKTSEVGNELLNEKNIKPFLKTGKESERLTGRNCFYPIYVENNKIISFGEVPDDMFHPKSSVIKNGDVYEIWPITEDGKERKWRYARISVEDIKEQLIFSDIKRKANSILMIKEIRNYKTIWQDAKYNVAEYGTNLQKRHLNLLTEDENLYPKSLFTAEDVVKIAKNTKVILDFFAGSGTTAHAVMKLNKEDGGKRKFILIEMANYFDTVIIPRLKKVSYSFNWKEGKPVDTDGMGIFFKYQILEQYEDTLDNIELKENQQAQELFKDEYLLKYFLDFETKESPYLLNIEHLKNPFSYKLKVNLQEVGEPEEVVVDIPETFNYLLGLKVKKLKTRNNDRKYLFILGEKEGKDIAIVWREYYEKWKDEDFKKDKELIIEEIKDWNPQIVYVNGQSILTPKLGGDVDKAEIKFIEPEFKKLMGR
ncbi:MAG: DNA methyltransferase [candidate division WOR-3 bacterium]